MKPGLAAPRESPASGLTPGDGAPTGRGRRRRRRRSADRYTLVSIGVVLAALVAWTAVTNLWVRGSTAFPSPQALGSAFWGLFQEGYTGDPLTAHVGTSLLEAFSGYAMAVFFGTTAGLVVGYSRLAKSATMPFVDFMRPIPPISLVTLFVFYFGIGLLSKVVLIFLTGFWYMILATSDGVRSVPKDLIRAGESMGMSQFQLFRHVILPGTMPSILTGMRTALGISWSLVVAAELIAAHVGLGYIITNATNFFDIKTVYAAVFIIGAIGFLMDRGVVTLSRRLLHWQGR